MISERLKRQLGTHSIFSSLVVAIVLYFLIAWMRTPYVGLSLIDFHPYFISARLIPMMSFLLLVCSFWSAKYFRVYIFLALILLVLVSLFRYSSGHAFRYFPIFLYLFVLLVKDDKEERREGASLILSALFVFAAFHKINPLYLGGSEFIKGGSFTLYYDYWLPQLLPTHWPKALSFLPYLTTLLELGLGAGILFLPRTFSHLVAIFLLILVLINPAVVAVYFFLFPFLSCTDPFIFEWLKERRYKDFFYNPYFVGFFVFALISLGGQTNFVLYLLTIVPFTLAALWFHLNSLKKISSVREGFLVPRLKKKQVLIVPFLMGIFFVLSFKVLPSPFGFKMFSGRRFQVPYYILTLEKAHLCDNIRKRWDISPVADADFKYDQEGRCEFYFPSLGGVRIVTRELCQKDDIAFLEIRESSKKESRILNCSNFEQEMK